MHSVYLRPDIQVEPLIDRWYAWSHLIPPATAARNLTERSVKTMQSYIAAPQVHASAVKNPKMLGGPFIDCGGRRVGEIKELLADTLDKRGDLAELSHAIQELDDLLTAEATGASLIPLYPRIPASLRGYVELVYNRNHSPSFRLIEPLLYKSKFYKNDGQSLRLSVLTGDDRPFVLSTPRLASEDAIDLQLPFTDSAIDFLFKSKKTPRALSELLEVCSISQVKEALFRTFVTEDVPIPYRSYTGTGLRWRYFGHACILVETSKLSILFDPVLSYTYEAGISRYTYEDLPDVIDYVIITHNHQDHVLLETLLQLRHKIKQIIVPRNNGGMLEDPSLKLMLRQIGFKDVIDLEEFEAVPSEEGSIMALPFLGEHADLHISSKLAYLINLRDNKLLFAADSCNISPEMYEKIYAAVGEVRALFVGMECDGAPLSWLYGPLVTGKLDRRQDQSRRLNGSNCEQAMGIVAAMKCKEVFVYAMGQEPWLRYIMSLVYTPDSNPIIESDRLLRMCAERGMVAERLFGEREMTLN